MPCHCLERIVAPRRAFMTAAPAACVELRAIDTASGLVGVFATSRVAKGDNALLEDAHAVVQVTPSDAAVACAHCLHPLGDSPSAEGQGCSVQCTWRCGALFCCAQCRDAACRDSHGCICPFRDVAGDAEFSPLRQWAHQAGTVNALFLLCGSLLGSALARATAPEDVRGKFTRLRETYGFRAADRPWWEVASGCSSATSDAAQRRLRRALRDQVEESFTLLQAGFCSNRQPHRDAVVREELTIDLYSRLLGALHLCVQPVTAPSSLAKQCERLAQLPREQLIPALIELRPFVDAATQRRPRRRPKGGGASSAPVVAAGASEFKVSSLWAPADQEPAPAPPMAAPSSLPAAHDRDDIDWDDAPERVAAQLSDLGPMLFEGVSGLAVAPLCAAVNHSCLPNVQIEATWSEHRMRLAAIALRDIEPGEELRVAYVATSAAVAERRDALAAAGHRFTCSCPRCILDDTPAGERDTTMTSMSVSDLHALAKQAQERGDYQEAQALLQAILRSSTPDAEAHHALGVCLLAQGDWTGAHAVWAAAFQRWPQFPPLRAQAIKDASYWPAKDAPCADGEEGSALQSGALRHVIPGIACLSTMQLMSAADCAAAIAAAEAAAAGGGWTTQRHYAVPTTDVPVHTVPPVLALFNKALKQRIAPFIAAAFPDVVPSPEMLRIHDAFLVKYDATHDGRQRFLPVHEDESEISLTVALNPRSDYVGGGTFFESAHDAAQQVVCPHQGQVLAFRGSRRHGGEPITAGVRYIFAVFAWVQRS